MRGRRARSLEALSAMVRDGVASRPETLFVYREHPIEAGAQRMVNWLTDLFARECDIATAANLWH